MDHFKSFNVGGGGASSLPQLTTETVLQAMVASHETGTDNRTKSELTSRKHPNTSNTDNNQSTHKTHEIRMSDTQKSKSNSSLRTNS